MTALLLVASMISCAAPALKREGTVYVHEKTGVSYSFAPSAYTAEACGEAIARLLREVAGEVALYAVNGQSTERYLVTPAGRLLCADGVRLPSLSELPISEAKLFNYALNMATAAIVTDYERLQTLKTLCIGGVAFDADQIEPQITRDSYELRFIAAGEYTGLFYSLQYWQCAEDVLIYEALSDSDAAEVLYPGVSYTLVEEEGVTYARYNFGQSLIYDPVSGTCRAAGDVLSSQISE